MRESLFFISTFILSFGITFAVSFSSPLQLGNVVSILETNFAEISSLDRRIYIIGVICFLLTTIIARKAISELKSAFSGPIIATSLFLLILSANTLSIFISYRNNSDTISSYKKDLMEMPAQTIYAFSSYRLRLLYGDIFALTVYSLEKLDFYKYKNIEKELPEGLTLNHAEKGVQKIYLVIGESAFRGRMSLYGYNKYTTTPFLDSLACFDPSHIFYYDAISVANVTRDAVRFSLSFASPSNKKAFWEEKNVVELAKDAEYNTIWLSNQGKAGLYDNYPSYIARSSDHVFFESKAKKDDLDLLPMLNNHHEKGKKQFFILHLMGSHFPYSDRYDEIDNLYFGSKSSELDYEKSIHHTDRLLHKLYNYTVQTDSSSLIFYFSDHGASPDRGIHGLAGVHKSEYEIPFVILKHNVEQNVNAIASKYISDESYINNLSVSYILSELMGYSVFKTTIDNMVEQGRNIVLVDGSVIPYK